MNTLANKTELASTADEEKEAQHLVKQGNIDQAIAIYQRLKPHSSRILHILGVLYAEKKGDLPSAINCFQEALEIKEADGSDPSDTLAELGFAYQNICDFDTALIYHLRALTLRESKSTVDQKAVASSLLGLANALWGQKDLSQALIYAQRALTLNMSISSDNDRQIASNLAVLANIYHHSGDDIQALTLAKQALTLLERCSQTESSSFVAVLNNIGTIQVSAGHFDDALLTFIQVMHIYEKILPMGHKKRVTIEDNIRRMTQIRGNHIMNLFSRIQNNLIRFFLV